MRDFVRLAWHIAEALGPDGAPGVERDMLARVTRVAALLLGLGLAACIDEVEVEVEVDLEQSQSQPWPEELFLMPPATAKIPIPISVPADCPRRGGNLEILCDAPTYAPQGGPIRWHARGCLGGTCQRSWVGPPVPDFVALTIGTEELAILDEAEDGFMAFYRDPYDTSSCRLFDDDNHNCSFHVRVYAREGDVIGELHLNDYIARDDHIEVQDVHYADGIVYFNEACQSYSREAERRCSALIAVDVRTGQRKWRTRHLVSNSYFAILDDHVAVSYGFSEETPSLSLIDRRSGRVSWTTKPPYSAEYIERVDGSTIFTRNYKGKAQTYVVRNGQLVRGRNVAR